MMVVARSGRRTRRATVSNEQLEEMGPIDDVVLEWPGELPTTGEVQPLLLDLVDRGIIRILDIAFLTKDEDGSVRALDVGDLEQEAAAFAAFEGASAPAQKARFRPRAGVSLVGTRERRHILARRTRGVLTASAIRSTSSSAGALPNKEERSWQSAPSTSTSSAFPATSSPGVSPRRSSSWWRTARSECSICSS